MDEKFEEVTTKTYFSLQNVESKNLLFLFWGFNPNNPLVYGPESEKRNYTN